MRGFRTFLYFTVALILFSCKKKGEIILRPSEVLNRRLFEIVQVRKVISDNNFIYFYPTGRIYFELIIKNVSNLDLEIYYNTIPGQSASCIELEKFPHHGECLFWVDNGFSVKPNEIFFVFLPLHLPPSCFTEYEFQGVNFSILVSSSNDLSFYFEDNPSKPPYKIVEAFDRRKAYKYPFEFTYWVTNDIFWERCLFE